ncbi:hypothetical protein BET04_08625 [Caminicella sporogenes]|nr:hypothetical protein BET04_08625 [Caminicella sporogenes]
MKKFLIVLLSILLFCFLTFGFWTFFYYMIITSDIPVQYTPKEWNIHLFNVRILIFLGIATIICLYKLLTYKKNTN